MVLGATDILSRVVKFQSNQGVVFLSRVTVLRALLCTLTILPGPADLCRELVVQSGRVASDQV